MASYVRGSLLAGFGGALKIKQRFHLSHTGEKARLPKEVEDDYNYVSKDNPGSPFIETRVLPPFKGFSESKCIDKENENLRKKKVSGDKVEILPSEAVSPK